LTLSTVWSPGWSRSTRRRRAASWWRSAGPWLAPALFLVTLYVTHLTDIYDAALRNPLLHDVEHLAYVGTACALWSVATSRGRASSPRRVGAVFAVIGGSALLWVVVLSATTPLVPTYARELGVEAAIDDQRGAASLMWVGGMAVTLPLLIVSVWRWAAAEERIAERVESSRGPSVGAAAESGRADHGARPV
jgi:putative membrane protein